MAKKQHTYTRYGGREGKDSISPRIYVNRDDPDYFLNTTANHCLCGNGQ